MKLLLLHYHFFHWCFLFLSKPLNTDSLVVSSLLLLPDFCFLKNLVPYFVQVQLLYTECSLAERKVKDVLEREKRLKKIAAEESAKHLKAVKEVEEAQQLASLVQEALERQNAELATAKVSFQKSEIIDFSNSKWCRRYSKDEIEVATDNFSEDKKIGAGSCGSVYKCTLDHTSAAVKVLLNDKRDKREQFLREVNVNRKTLLAYLTEGIE